MPLKTFQRLVACASLALAGACWGDQPDDFTTVPVSVDETHFRLVVLAPDGRPLVSAGIVFDILRADLIVVRRLAATDSRGRYDSRYKGLSGRLPVEIRITPPGSSVTFTVTDSTRFEGTAVMRVVTVSTR